MTTIKLLSWNVRNLSVHRDPSDLVAVIRQYDIVALQEIRDIESVAHIAKAAGMSWRVSDPVCSTWTTAHQSGRRTERYAFLWTAQVTLVTEPQLVHADHEFVRSPFIGYFRCGTLGSYDFILSTIHIVWGTVHDREVEIANVGRLLNAIIAKAGTEGDIILCGDFNTAPEGFHLPTTWRHLIDGRTTVSKVAVKSGGGIGRYDNIWINTPRNFTGHSGIIHVEHNSSDHYPIYAEFNASYDADEGDVKDLKIELN